MPFFDMTTYLMTAVAILIVSPYGSTADCQLDITSSLLLGRPMFGEMLGPYKVGQSLTLICSPSKVNCGNLTWWEERGTLLNESSTLKLSLGSCDEGRRLQCRAGTTANKTVQLDVSDDKENPCTTAKPQTATTATTTTTIATSTSKATTTQVADTYFTSVNYFQTSNTSTISKTNNSENSSIAQVEESVTTATVRQGIPVPVTVTSKSVDEDSWTLYLIIGSVIFVGGLALSSIIASLLLFRKVNMVVFSSYPSPPLASAQENSEESSSVGNTRVNIGTMMSLDFNALPPTAPLLVSKPRVGGVYDLLLSRGGASVTADDRDHSYYYPEQTNFYHYPDISQDVREQILHDSK